MKPGACSSQTVVDFQLSESSGRWPERNLLGNRQRKAELQAAGWFEADGRILKAAGDRGDRMHAHRPRRIFEC